MSVGALRRLPWLGSSGVMKDAAAGGGGGALALVPPKAPIKSVLTEVDGCWADVSRPTSAVAQFATSTNAADGLGFIIELGGMDFISIFSGVFAWLFFTVMWCSLFSAELNENEVVWSSASTQSRSFRKLADVDWQMSAGK